MHSVININGVFVLIVLTYAFTTVHSMLLLLLFCIYHKVVY